MADIVAIGISVVGILIQLVALIVSVGRILATQKESMHALELKYVERTTRLETKMERLESDFLIMFRHMPKRLQGDDVHLIEELRAMERARHPPQQPDER